MRVGDEQPTWATWEPAGEGTGHDISLGDAEVHVWRARLDRSPGEVQLLNLTLGAAEHTRAARLRCEQQRFRFISGRGILRSLAARYLACDPGQLQLSINEQGKPVLADESLSFNLSHAGGFGLFAFALHRRIGIDVESATRRVAADRIAERFLHESEASQLRSLQSVEMRHRAFLCCWTRKEAYLKATGEGIAAGALSNFEVSVDPQLPARLERVEADPDEAARWHLQDLPLEGTDFVGAVCAEGRNWRLCCFESEEV